MPRPSPITALLALTVALAAIPFAGAGAQARPDSAGRDSARTLDRVRITVTRTNTSAQRAPWAVATVERGEIARGQATLGIDEALNNVPGVIVSNRYNWSVDQRLSIRGTGARANFGIRGVKVLLDGVPQSLPDGQNQMTNVDLGAVSRVEVLRGSASSLYGNGSGGVIAFESDRSAQDRLDVSARLLTGSFGTSKLQARVSGRNDHSVAALSLSRTRVAGFRQYDSAETRQATAAYDRSLGAARTLELRASYADVPVSLNPGALTAAEYAANRDSASATNINRGANKTLSQGQYSARLRHAGERGEWAVVGYVMRRFVDNPLATSPRGAPAGAAGAAIGTYSTLNRWVTGARADAAVWSREAPSRARATFGVDLQRSFDIRRNWRATGGKLTAPSDTVLLDQGEAVTALGPFVTAQLSPVEPLTLSAGLRHDWVTFAVTDNFLRDGTDNSGSRTMSALSGHAGASWVFSHAVTAYANVANAFETPTTTELSARPGGLGGFNPELGPQRIRTIEGGLRGDVGTRVRYTATVFEAAYTSAIVQYLETNGRAYFRNAGESRNRGLELGVSAHVAPWLELSLARTESQFRFTHYLAPQTATVTDTLDGKRVAGVPDLYYRVGLRTQRGGFTADLDHTWSGDVYGNDRNTVRVDNWGRGALNARFAWEGTVRGTRVAPFVGVNNALDVAYIGSVTVNGAFGRMLEPAPLRNFHLGVETGWRVAR